MQYEIVCKHCHRKFAIAAQGGETLRCKCPYCQGELIAATPVGSTVAATTTPSAQSRERAIPPQKHVPPPAATPHPPHERGLGVKVTIVFSIVVAVVLTVSTLLYIVFSAISK